MSDIDDLRATVEEAVATYRAGSSSDYRAAAAALIRIAADLVDRYETEKVPAPLPEDADFEALGRFVRHAKAHHGGHFTLLRFTTNWRAQFGTIEWSPDLDEFWQRAIGKMPAGETMAQAIEAAFKHDRGQAA